VKLGEDLFGASLGELVGRCQALKLPPFRARQIYRALYHRRVADFRAITDLPLTLRDDLASRFRIDHPRPLEQHRSRDGTVRVLLELPRGGRVEAVAIPEARRHTVCLSTQVGCPLQCSFCFSGTVRFERNLDAGEILGQLVKVLELAPPSASRTNVVFMGMGEPLLNREAVLASIRILTDPDAFAISPRRVTVSTAGLAAELERFVESAPPVGIAVSLHATTNAGRQKLMPINQRYPLEELLATARRIPLPRRRRITFEYVMLGGENDSPQEAERLAALLSGIKAKVNLIVFNPWPGAPHRRATPASMERFMDVLVQRGVTVSLRKSRGDDVLAACGQLAARPAPESAARS
jgi:23S rRNA (adenine2503-C2)-methyltransferase